MNRILIYSGHGRIVGGDAKYLFGLTAGLSRKDFAIWICTDKNHVFEARAREWPRMDLEVEYLATRPAVFPVILSPDLLSRCGKSSHWGAKLVRAQIGGYTVERWCRYIAGVITLEPVRNAVHNIVVFRRLLRRHKPTNLVHFNNGGYPGKRAGYCAIVAAWLTGIDAIVMTVHSEPIQRRGPVDWMIDLISRSLVNLTICPSEAVARQLAEVRGLDSRKVRVIYCGLPDCAPLPPDRVEVLKRQLGLGNEIVLSICGTLDEDRKGHAVLFKALAIVATSGVEFHLLVVGDATQHPERLEQLRELAAELGLGARVRFLGYRIDTHELAALSDIVLVPSTEGEATPYTIKEGARAGRVVITTDAGGCAEGVIPGVSGFVVKAGDHEELAARIMQLCEDPALRSQMGAEGRKFFLQRFLQKTEIARHEEAYREVLGESQPGTALPGNSPEVHE